MKLTDDTDLLVGEYVLGTLEREERKKLEEIADREPTVAAAVMVWERRLAPLHELVVAVEPPGSIWPQITERLDETPQAPREYGPGFFEVITELARSHGADSAMHLVEKMRRWRAAALVFGALALVAAGFLAAELLRPAPLPQVPLIAVLRSETFASPFIVALDLDARTLEVRSVPSATSEDRSYAFWLLRGEQAPLALGRLRGTGVLKPDAFARIDRASLRMATVGVTVEPNGAPQDRPIGPFIYRGRFE